MSSGASTSSGPEYFVRGLNDTDARGPFNLEQLLSLAEAGQVTPETYFYDNTTEQWLQLSTNTDLKAQLWPEKRKLSFKDKEFKPLNQETESKAPITVQQFLDAAEGRSDETKGKKDKSLEMMRAAIWGTRGASSILLISAVVLILPGLDALLALDLEKVIAKPLVILGAIDLVVGVMLLLGVISLYPFVRFRAVFGLGLLGFLFAAQGDFHAVVPLLAGSLGLYFCTIFVSYLPLAVALLAGIGGMAMLTTMSLF